MSTTRKRRWPLAYRILAACETAHHDHRCPMTPLDAVCTYPTIDLVDWRTLHGFNWYLEIEELVPRLAAAGYLEEGPACQKVHSARGRVMSLPTYAITEKGKVYIDTCIQRFGRFEWHDRPRSHMNP